MRKIYLWRFKSNPKTIIQRFGDKYVQIVWSGSFSDGGNASFCYLYEPDNMIPLSQAEAEEIIALRKGRGLPTENIGTMP